MTIIEAIRAVIAADATLSAILTSGDTLRVYPGFAEDGAGYPNVVLRALGGPSGLCQDGPDGMHDGIMQIDVFANDYDDSFSIAKAIKRRLHGYRGDLDGITLQRVTCNEPMDLTDDDGAAMTPPIYRHQLELETDYYQE